MSVDDLYYDTTVADIAKCALETAPSTFTRIANSMGSAVVFEASRRAPRRIEALIFVGTTAHPGFAEQSARRCRSPVWDLSPHKVELLLQEGFIYENSMMGMTSYPTLHARAISCARTG